MAGRGQMQRDAATRWTRNIWLSAGTAVLFLTGGTAFAEAPDTSLRPSSRPGQTAPEPMVTAIALQAIGNAEAMPRTIDRTQVTAEGVTVRIGADTRPRPRGEAAATEPVAVVSRQIMPVYYTAEIRPNPRPDHPLAASVVTPVSAKPASSADTSAPEARPAGFGNLFRKRGGGYSKKGSICGVNAIKGTKQQSFGKPNRGCGVEDPVKVTEVSGVRLSTPATIDCDTAKALNSWVENGVKPAFGRKGGGVAELHVVAHYACRNRNNRAGGRLSEHAKGHAVDIAGFRLEDGTEVTVQDHWRSRRWSKTMRSIHGAACGPFGTVLGPNADRYHQDHFHVDTARYRSGPYCR